MMNTSWLVSSWAARGVGLRIHATGASHRGRPSPIVFGAGRLLRCVHRAPRSPIIIPPFTFLTFLKSFRLKKFIRRAQAAEKSFQIIPRNYFRNAPIGMFSQSRKSAKKCFPNLGFLKRFELVNFMSRFDMNFPRFGSGFWSK